MTLFPWATYAQGYDANWVFGKNAGIDFSDPSNPQTFSSICNNGESSSSISDSNGSLIAYLSSWNGLAIRNIANDTILNSNLLKTESTITNGSVFLPIDNNRILFLYLGSASGCVIPRCNTLYKAELQKNEDNGNWFVSSKNTEVYTGGRFEERLGVIKHANGIDYWVIAHGRRDDNLQGACNDTFFVFKVHLNDVSTPLIQKVGASHCQQLSEGGEIAISPDGQMFAMALYGQNIIDVLIFDRCDGVVSHETSIPTISEPYGVGISPSKQQIYYTTGNGGSGELLQYTMSSLTHTLIWSSQNLIYKAGQLEVAPDGKIY